MKPATVAALAEINRCFYRDHAAAFSETRAEPWPGWEKLLPSIRSAATGGPLTVLDLGCGNGRFLRYLTRALPEREIRGVGVDASAPLLAAARENTGADHAFVAGDFVAAPEALPEGPFSLVAMFGVVHGVPGRERREALLRAAASRLAPGGILVFTIWRLGVDPRIAGRLQDAKACAKRARVDASELEPGDHLLPWGDAPGAARYVHVMGEVELREQCAALPLAVHDRFRADGRSGELNEYFVFRAG